MKKSRLWCFTNFDLEFDYKSYLESCSAEYIAYGLETCPETGRKHHQGFVYFECQRGSIKNVAKELGKCNVRMCNGNLDQNIDYCSKEGELIELGIKPKQGRRTDLKELIDKIATGTTEVDELVIETPHMFHQYGRTLSAAEDIYLRKKYRNFMTEGLWIYGPTGVGKSHEAFKDFTPETHYVYPNDGGWWDGYKGQEVVIINEFRGGIPYGELLDLVDKWPKTVRRRGREPMPFLAKKVIITSSLKPCQVYNNLADEDSLAQLLRRFEVCFLAQKCSEGNTESSEQKSN